MADNNDREYGQLSPSGQLFLSVLEKQRNAELPLFICEKINEAINTAAEEFLAAIRYAAKELLFDKFDEVKEERGLYVDWYDEEKVETTIRLFPSVLSETVHIGRLGGGRSLHPIMWPLRAGNHGGAFNFKAASLIPLLAELAMEFGQFTKIKRGGLLVLDLSENTLQILCTSQADESDDKEYHQLIDETVLAIMKKLRDRNLLKKEDIREHDLLGNMFAYSSKSFCIERRFHFLSDWDPVALMTPRFPDKEESYLPIHYSTDYHDIRSFLSALDAGMRHYPTKLGFAFTEGEDDQSREIPYHEACQNFGEEVVKREVLDRIMNCPEADTEHFLLTVAADETIRLDGLYILVRREPAALQRLLQGGNSNNSGGSAPAAISSCLNNDDAHLFESNRKRKPPETEGDDRSSSNKYSNQNSNNSSGGNDNSNGNDSSKKQIDDKI